MSRKKKEEVVTDDSLNAFNERHDYWTNYLAAWIKATDSKSNGIERKDPYKSVSALLMFEEGATMKMVREKLGWNHSTCQNFQARHFDTIQENKKAFSRAFALSAHQGLEVLSMKWEQLRENEEALLKTSPKDIAIAVGVMTDKGAMLDGMATHTIEVRRGASIGDAQQMIEEARKRIAQKTQVIEAEVIE